METKRALWLINNPHTREYEVSTLLKNGYEVFTPKVARLECGLDNASVTWEYDRTLSLSAEDLDTLNRTDFYGEIPEKVKAIINGSFQIAFVQYYPEQLRALVTHFSGGIVLRASGCGDRYTYTERITEDLGYGFHKRLKKIMNRFWFTEMYPGIAEREGDYLRRGTETLPDGLAPVAGAAWQGDSREILIHYPGIQLSPERYECYHGLRDAVKKIPHFFVGLQPIPVENDPTVTGSPAQLTHGAGFWDPTQGSFELPYAALAAMQAGMPVIYMQESTLGRIKSTASRAGSCTSFKDAAAKIKRLQRHDRQLCRKLLDDQQKLLELFSPEKADRLWSGFLKTAEKMIEESRRQPARPFRIGIIMPNNYTGGVLDYSARLMKCIQMGAAEAGDQVEVFFGHKAHPVFDSKNYFKPFEENHVAVSSFSWESKDQAWLKRTVSLDGCQMKEYPACCCIMNDCTVDFEEADYLIITADRAEGEFFSRCPFAVLAHDYIQRYVPAIVSLEYENILYNFQRQADAVFVTSAPNYIDALQCGGNRRQRTYLTPLMYDLIEHPAKGSTGGRNNSSDIVEEKGTGKKARPYFIWSTNPARHKNHIRALQGLNEYYARGGKLKCYMTGANTQWLNLKNAAPDNAYIAEIRGMIQKYKGLKDNLKILGEITKTQYTRILEEAKFVFHPGFADNDSGIVIDAASLGVPAISGDCTVMRYINDQTDIQMHFFDLFDSENIAQALIEAEQKCMIYRAELPAIKELEKHTLEGSYREIYRTIKKVTGI